MREGKKKTIRERHSGFHTPRLAKRVVWPQTAKFNQRGKSCVSFDFLKLLEDFQKDAPAKVPLCDAERMLESSGKQRIGDFPLRSEKLRQGKVATLAKKKKRKDFLCTKIRAQSASAVQGRNMKRSRDVTKENRYIFCKLLSLPIFTLCALNTVICHQRWFSCYQHLPHSHRCLL